MTSSDFDSDSTADPFDWDALARYVSGESTPAEAVAVRAWLDARPERAQLVAALRRSIDTLAADSAAGVDVEDALRKVHARMAEPVATPVRSIASARRARIDRLPARTGREWRSTTVAAAAAVVIAAALGVWFMRSTMRAHENDVVAAASYSTAVGGRDSVRLSDGTTVILGPSSELVVAAGYGVTAREVELRGEGYFDVVHDAARPFTVHANGATIVDVGTAFSVRGDVGGAVRVSVTSGVVRMKGGAAGDSGVILTAGQVGTLGSGASIAVASHDLTAADTAFRHGHIVFRDAPLARVSAEMRRWYGIELRPADSATARHRLTATFDAGNPEQALALIGAALGATVERHGDTAVVRAPR